ncbi:hypothetical protein FS837_006678 [Tulasnella sp. UAMH 9824]|nr:hypothetical protein FS837_006678 [Tulasnella sp. UAMH 9824]
MNFAAPSQLDPTHSPIQPTPAPTPNSSKGMEIGIAICATILLVSGIMLYLLKILPVRSKGAQPQRNGDPEGSAQSNSTDGTMVRRSRVLVKVTKTRGCVHALSIPGLSLSAQDGARAGGRLLHIFSLSFRNDSNILHRPSSSALTVVTCNSIGSVDNTLETSGGSGKPRIAERNDERISPVDIKDPKAERERERDTTSLTTLETMKFGREDGDSEIYED